MKISRWQILMAVSLVAASVILYDAHFLLFHDAHHIFIYLLGDIAFLPIEVLLVTMVLHELLSSREKRTRLQKLNMVIGAFFTEIGTKLLVVFSDADPELAEIKKELVVTNTWSDRDFAAVVKRLKRHQFNVDLPKIDLLNLKHLLDKKKDFVVRLFENQSLLEHERFTDLLWAVTHIDEELASRKDLNHLKEVDAGHISNDVKRAYGHLVELWLDHLKHLKKNYPHLFSLAIRTNPFDESATPEIG